MKDAITLLTSIALILIVMFMVESCSDDKTYIVSPKHHDHGKGHHKMDGLVLCLDSDPPKWVKPEDCICRFLILENWELHCGD